MAERGTTVTERIEMWSIVDPSTGITNKVIIPTDGIVSIVKPKGVKISAFINDVDAPLHHLHVKTGDEVCFEITNTSIYTKRVAFEFGGSTSYIEVAAGAVTEVITVDDVVDTMEENKMTPAETINLFANPGMGNGMGGAGAGAGAGLGAGLLGGVLGGTLLGGRRGGFLGEDGGGGVVTPALLAASLASVTETQNNTAVLQTLGNIQASIPLAEGQVQLALAGAQADINGNISAGLQTAINGQAGINANISTAIATSLASQSQIKDLILTTGAALGQAIANSQFNITSVVRDDGDKTRSLIISQNDALLNRQLATAEAALLEQRAIGRSRDVEVNVTQTVTQNQAQLQAQTQQQQQFQVLANLVACVNNLANDIQVVRQTQSNVNFGVQGTAGQTASAANTRVN